MTQGETDYSREATMQQVAIDSIIIEYILRVSENRSISSLVSYCQSMKEKRIEDNQWTAGLEISEECYLSMRYAYLYLKLT